MISMKLHPRVSALARCDKCTQVYRDENNECQLLSFRLRDTINNAGFVLVNTYIHKYSVTKNLTQQQF